MDSFPIFVNDCLTCVAPIDIEKEEFMDLLNEFSRHILVTRKDFVAVDSDGQESGKKRIFIVVSIKRFVHQTVVASVQKLLQDGVTKDDLRGAAIIQTCMSRPIFCARPVSTFAVLLSHKTLFALEFFNSSLL